MGELQRRLSAAGFSTGGVDGIIGPNTIEAVRRYLRGRLRRVRDRGEDEADTTAAGGDG